MVKKHFNAAYFVFSFILSELSLSLFDSVYEQAFENFHLKLTGIHYFLFLAFDFILFYCFIRVMEHCIEQWEKTKSLFFSFHPFIVFVAYFGFKYFISLHDVTILRPPVNGVNLFIGIVGCSVLFSIFSWAFVALVATLGVIIYEKTHDEDFSADNKVEPKSDAIEEIEEEIADNYFTLLMSQNFIDIYEEVRELNARIVGILSSIETLLHMENRTKVMTTIERINEALSLAGSLSEQSRLVAKKMIISMLEELNSELNELELLLDQPVLEKIIQLQQMVVKS